MAENFVATLLAFASTLPSTTMCGWEEPAQFLISSLVLKEGEQKSSAMFWAVGLLRDWLLLAWPGVRRGGRQSWDCRPARARKAAASNTTCESCRGRADLQMPGAEKYSNTSKVLRRSWSETLENWDFLKAAVCMGKKKRGLGARYRPREDTVQNKTWDLSHQPGLITSLRTHPAN